jgi:hypothetical protein
VNFMLARLRFKGAHTLFTDQREREREREREKERERERERERARDVEYGY